MYSPNQNLISSKTLFVLRLRTWLSKFTGMNDVPWTSMLSSVSIVDHFISIKYKIDIKYISESNSSL